MRLVVGRNREVSHGVDRSTFLRLLGRILRILLTGIDGSGKSTAARKLRNAILRQSREAIMLKTVGGRKTMTGWWEALGWAPNTRWQDRIETLVRGVNAVLNEVRIHEFDGVIILDRGLVCQLALRQARGLPSGYLLRWLQCILPAPDVIVYFDLPGEKALARVNARGTDVETLAGLIALDAGYRNLPEYANFTIIDADQPTADIVLNLLALTYQGRGQPPHQKTLISS